MSNITKTKNTLTGESRLDEAVLPPALKTFMDFWSKRLGLSMRVTKASKGKTETYSWLDYEVGAYTKTNIFLGRTAISFATETGGDKMFMRSANGSTNGLFMGAGWDENNIDAAKRDVEKLMNKLYPPPSGSDKEKGKKFAKSIAKQKRGR